MISPYVELLGTYETGLIAPTIDSTGQFSQTDSYGGSAAFGLTGMHNWRRSLLAINYRGTYQHYNRQHYLSGVNQSLTLGLTHALSPHMTLNLVETAGIYANGMTMGQINGVSTIPGMGSIVDPNSTYVPGADVLDTQTRFSSSSVDLTIAKSARLSFNVGGTGFFVRRRAAGFAGVNGAAARGDIGYRLTRRQTIGVQYIFDHFGYTNTYGESNVHATGFFHQIQLTPHLDFGYMLSGYRFESLQTVTVSLDPVVASLLGVSRTSQINHATIYGASGGAHLTYDYRRTSLNLNASRRVVPGSGIYLASRQELVSAGVGYRGTSRITVGLSASYQRMQTMMQSLKSYTSYSTGGTFAYRLASVMHLMAHSGVRSYHMGSASVDRTTFYAQFGIGFAPHEFGFPNIF